jgi:ribonuclease PH
MDLRDNYLDDDTYQKTVIKDDRVSSTETGDYELVDGEVKLDLNYEEDSHAQVDSNVVLTKSGKIIEFQTTAEGEPYEFDKMIEIFNVAKKGILQIIEKYSNLE